MLRITVELDVTGQVADQVRRAGFEVCKEGRKLLVKVPNQTIPAGSAKIKFEEVVPATA